MSRLLRTAASFVAAVWSVLALGCVSPSYSGTCRVASELAVRTGHELCPPAGLANGPAETLISWEDGLTEEEAASLGLWNNPDFQELLADLGIARADVIQAAQLTNPQINTMFPLGPKQWEFALMVPLDVLWLRPMRVAAAQLESARAAERLVQDGLNVVRDVRVAYINWILAVEQAHLAVEGAGLRGEIARIADARLRAGAVAELDVSATSLDATIGEGEALRAATDVELASEQLRYVLGLQLSPVMPLPPAGREAGHVLPRELLGELPFDFDVEALVGEAAASRPDLRAVALAVSAAEERAALARRGLWNLQAILPDVNSRGTKGFEAGPGLQFTLPIFHQNQGAIAQAAADAERLRRQYNRIREAAALEVRRAYTQLVQAQQELQLWQEQITPRAVAAVASARRALQEDSVSLLLMLETSRQLLSARARALEAEAQVWRALAELERSVGRRLFASPGPHLRDEEGMEALMPPVPDSVPENF